MKSGAVAPARQEYCYGLCVEHGKSKFTTVSKQFGKSKTPCFQLDVIHFNGFF